MGNGSISGDKKDRGQKQTTTSSSKTKQITEFLRRKSVDNLIFYACTDKARV
jgi:hypothetical protein